MRESFSRRDHVALLVAAGCLSAACSAAQSRSLPQPGSAHDADSKSSVEVVREDAPAEPAWAFGTDAGPSLEAVVNDGPLPPPTWTHRTHSADPHHLLWVDTNELGETVAGGWVQGAVSVAGTDLGEDDERHRAFVVLFDRLGELLWSRVVRGGGVRQLRAIPDGEGFVALFDLERAVDVGCGCVQAVGHGNHLLARLSRNGDCLWQRVFGDMVLLDVDRAGDVYLVERERVGESDEAGRRSNRHQMVVSRLSSSGETEWKTALGDHPDEWANLIGAFEERVAVVTHFSCRGEECPELSRRGMTLNLLDAHGRRLWSRDFDASGGRVFVMGVAPAPGGEVYASGWFSGLVDLGGGPLKSRGLTDGFLVKYDASGEHLWSRSIGGPANDAVIHMNVDPSGFVDVSGVLNDEGACEDARYPLACLEGTSFVARIDSSSGEIERTVGLGKEPCMGHVSWDAQGFSFLGPRVGRTVGESESPLTCGGRMWEAEDAPYLYIIRYEWPEVSP